jgi:hypothetical protein
MSSPTHAFVVGACVVALLSACASGRVRGGQGTEMGQAEEYQPDKKVDPPTGNVDKTSGPLEPIDTYPALEIDLERRRRPVGPALEPEPDPQPQPEPGNAPEQSQ